MAVAPDTASGGVDLTILLTVLAQHHEGDFTARMPLEWTGVAGKVADRLNDVIIANQALESELAGEEAADAVPAASDNDRGTDAEPVERVSEPSFTAEPERADTILVVEDDPAVRAIVTAMLMDVGYRVLGADGQATALAITTAHGSEIDLLLTDLVMPGGSGRETAEQIRALYPAIKVLYMSGYTDDTAIRDGGLFEPGVSFIQKPFGSKDLAQRVREVLESEVS